MSECHQRFVRALEERGCRKGSQFCCPAHDDHKPSLSVDEGHDGRVLLKCHAGCTPEDVVAALGLTMADLFEPNGGRSPRSAPKLVAAYDYVSENGDLLFQVCRYDPKDFRQRRPDGKGGWIWDLKDVRRVLFRLPHVLEAAKAGETVYIVEGEKDVLSVEAAGAVATCNPGGAGKWREEYSGSLAGTCCRVVADSDEPGRKHARQVAASLRAAGVSVEVLLPARGKDVSDHLGSGLGLEDLLPLPDEAEPGDEGIESKDSHLSDRGDASLLARTHDQDERDGPPTITVRGGALPTIIDDAETALLSDPGPRIYQRAGLLVRVIRMESLTVRRGLTREAGALVIHPIETPYLVERFTAAARWRKYDQRMGRCKAIDCPEQVAKAYMARRGSWRVAPLIGIIEAPTLRADGSILDTPGYDEATGLYFDPGPFEFPKIPEYPSREDALEALDELYDVLKDFPFVDPQIDGMAAVAAILTALVRKSLPSAPLFVFRAPKMRSGKTLLADVVSMVATGRRCAVMTQALGPERGSEERKRLLAILIEGDPVVNFDNCEHALEGAALCVAITQETIKDRVLGASKTATVSTAITFLATGNNLAISGDLVARVLPCDLDPRVERPEERVFDRDLYEFVPEHRPRLVASALTILRAYHVAGMPEQPIPRWGGFDEWSRRIRGSLAWLGQGDPAAGRGRLEVLDPVKQNLRALLLAWQDALQDRTVSVSQLVEKSDQHADLKAVLIDVAGDTKGGIRARSLGWFLQKHMNRIEGGLRIERAGDRQGKALWRVCRIGEP